MKRSQKEQELLHLSPPVKELIEQFAPKQDIITAAQYFEHMMITMMLLFVFLLVLPPRSDNCDPDFSGLLFFLLAKLSGLIGPKAP